MTCTWVIFVDQKSSERNLIYQTLMFFFKIDLNNINHSECITLVFQGRVLTGGPESDHI